MALLGRGTGFWDIHIYIFLSFPPASFALLALLQTLRRHQGRLLRQRLNFSAPLPLLGCKFLSTVLSLTVRLSCSSCRKSSTRKWRIALSCSR